MAGSRRAVRRGNFFLSLHTTGIECSVPGRRHAHDVNLRSAALRMVHTAQSEPHNQWDGSLGRTMCQTVEYLCSVDW